MSTPMGPFRPIEHTCMICKEVIPKVNGGIVFSLESHILKEHPTLIEYDAQKSHSTVLHQRCFLKWENRRQYIHLFNEYHKSVDAEDYSIRMRSHGEIEWRWFDKKRDD